MLIAVNGEKIREPEPELGEAPLVPEREKGREKVSERSHCNLLRGQRTVT